MYHFVRKDVFLYDQQSNNDTDFQKVHIPFGRVFLTRSCICYGSYVCSKGNLRLRGTFHTNEYDYRKNDMGDHNYLVDPNDWESIFLRMYYLRKEWQKIKPTSVVADKTSKKEVGNIHTLLQNFYKFSESFLDVLGKK